MKQIRNCFFKADKSKMVNSYVPKTTIYKNYYAFIVDWVTIDRIREEIVKCTTQIFIEYYDKFNLEEYHRCLTVIRLSKRSNIAIAKEIQNQLLRFINGTGFTFEKTNNLTDMRSCFLGISLWNKYFSFDNLSCRNGIIKFTKKMENSCGGFRNSIDRTLSSIGATFDGIYLSKKLNFRIKEQQHWEWCCDKILNSIRVSYKSHKKIVNCYLKFLTYY